jgi:CheY-like chemotaxis protein
MERSNELPSGVASEALVAAVAGRKRRKASRTPATFSAPRPTLDLRGLTILIVEDHADSRALLCDIVESFGATVVVAEDGYDAVKKVSWIQADLVLCDLRMPRLDGFGFIDWLRNDPKLSRTPVIAVTALGADADYRRTWAAGFNGHIVKPIDYRTIAAQLDRVFWAHARMRGK